MPALADRYDVPGFRDPALLQEMVREARVGALNWFSVVGTCLLLVAGFVGWVFAAEPYLRQRSHCEASSRSVESARDLCRAWRKGSETTASSEALEKECRDVPTTMVAFDYCMNGGSTDANLGEKGQFALVAAAAGLVGLLFVTVGVVQRRKVPRFVQVLREPQRIVWIHECDVEVRREGSSWITPYRTVNVGLDSGEIVPIGEFVLGGGHRGQSLVDPALEQHAARLLPAVVALAPAASVGWSEELARRFQENPAQLVHARAQHPGRKTVAA